MVPHRKCAGIGCKLREHIRCSELSADEVARFESTMTVRTFARDEKIFKQDTESSGLFCLRSGHALLWHSDAYNHKTAFRVVGAGEMMGYRSLFGEDTHAATAQALTVCDVCFYPKQTVLKMVDEFPGFARGFFRTLARDRGPRDALLLRGQHIPVRIRLVNLLLLMNTDEVCPDDGVCVLRLPMLRRDIAALLAARPESIARAIKELGQDGIAKFNGRTVTIPDLAALAAETTQETTPQTSAVMV